MNKILETIAQSFSLLWRLLDQGRRITVNLLFLLGVILLFGLLLYDDTPKVEDGTALVAAPTGFLVEQLYTSPVEEAIMDVLGQDRPETLMKNLLKALELAAEDERIAVVLVDLDKLAGGGLSKLQSLVAALEKLKAEGKTVIATADFFGQPQYYLASVADEIYLHHMGMVLLTGYGSYRRYYREALDKLEVDWNVFRVGEYKSAVEPFMRSDMSPEDREARQVFLSELWSAYKEGVTRARGISDEELEDYVNRFHIRLREHDGEAAELAKSAGLVDAVVNRDEVRDRLIELVGEDEATGSYRSIDFRSYLRAVDEPSKKNADIVAVVVAKGEILNGNQPPGRIGGDSTARLIRRAREDEQVKALVLRVDSPGGSSFASEIIRREVELTKDAGKPIIASFSSVAASGGYWISMTADEIWASPSTLTGSIGIYAMVPTFERTLARFGIRSDGVGTSPLAGTLRLDRTLPREAVVAIQSMIDQGYQEFIDKAAAGRDMSPEEIDRIGRGRIWSGETAHQLGLVDHLGNLDQAVEAAAAKAELGDDYKVVYIETEISDFKTFLARLVMGAERWMGAGLRAILPEMPFAREEVLDFDDPRGIVAYCFCEPH